MEFYNAYNVKSGLLAEYPAADDVVNIIVDAEYKSFLGFPISATYTMSGIAIDYK